MLGNRYPALEGSPLRSYPVNRKQDISALANLSLEKMIGDV
jgi:hypothetical protein